MKKTAWREKHDSKIGIVTITNGPDNYGNVLQNYALQCAVRDFGFEVETIQNLSYVEYRRFNLYIIPKLLRNYHAAIKSMKFLKFRYKYINVSRKVITVNSRNLEYFNKKYKKIICGSDQIWNPNYKSNQRWEIMLLSFAPPKKRVSYAASFGVDELPESLREQFVRDLTSFNSISVRENSAADIVQDLIGVRPEAVIDPTLFVDAKHWHELAKPINKLKQKSFVLEYCLGDDKNHIVDGVFEQLQVDNPELIRVNVLSDDYNYLIGPGEFLWLIENSKAVITDSFHGTVFLILFHKKFGVFVRTGHNSDIFSRLETLLSKFKLTDHIVNEENRTFLNTDWEKVDEILVGERAVAERFLEKSLIEAGDAC